MYYIFVIGYESVFFPNLNHSSYFKKSLEVVDLSKGHGYKNKGFKKGPPYHAAIGVVINCEEKKYDKSLAIIHRIISNFKGFFQFALPLFSSLSTGQDNSRDIEMGQYPEVNQLFGTVPSCTLIDSSVLPDYPVATVVSISA